MRRRPTEQSLFRRLQELERGPLEQLGELVRAAVDELRISQARIAEQALRLRRLEDALDALTARVGTLQQPPPPEPAPPAGHLLLLAGADGYVLVARDGAPPAPGEEIEHAGRPFHVLRSGRSPLPGDARPCLLAFPFMRYKS